MDAEDDSLDILWNNLIEDWDNAAAHDAFLQMAFDQSALGVAAGRYRGQLEDEARRELAEKKLKAIAMLAMQGLQADKTEPSKGAPRWLVWLAASVFASAVALLAYAMSR